VLSIYRGPYLPKLDNEWAIIQRENLHQKFISAATNLVNLLLKAKQYQKAITAIQRVLEIDPCSESAHRSAMIAYAEMGDRAGVVRQFEKCKKALMEELNVSPSSQTIDVYKSLMK
jgi:DNA-binding SARP family transcriptional activator